MKARFLILAIALRLLLINAQGQPIRLAIVTSSPQMEAIGDRLTAEFSRSHDIQLLERKEIARVYREQSLTGGNLSQLKLGETLGADGLLILETDGSDASPFLDVSLVAVKPGVVLLSDRFNWPIEGQGAWVSAMAKRVEEFSAKLRVLRKDAVPISVVNLRSAIQGDQERELERQLTLLTIARLSREPRLFVLERRRMESLTDEKNLKGLDETAFWNGSYLLDGTLDKHGYSSKPVTLWARLIPPDKGRPILIEATGSRTNYTEVINQFADKLLTSLKLERIGTPWNAHDEAEQYFTEAEWALKWGLSTQAQTAAEAAWALGKRNSDTAEKLFQAYVSGMVAPGYIASSPTSAKFANTSQIPLLTRALGFLSENSTEYFGATNFTTIAKFKLACKGLGTAAANLDTYYQQAESRAGREEELAELRRNTRAAFVRIESHPVPKKEFPYGDQVIDGFPNFKWQNYGVCCDRPEDAIPEYKKILEAGANPERLPPFAGWSWEDRLKIPGIMKQFLEDICANTNPAVQLIGFYLALLNDPDDESGSLERAEQRLFSAMWDHRDLIYANRRGAILLDWTFAYIKPQNEKPYIDFIHRLRMDYVQNPGPMDLNAFIQLFANHLETAEQARELLPHFLEWQQKFPTRDSMKRDAIQHVAESLRQEAGIQQPAKTPPTQVAGENHPPEESVKAKFIPWGLKRPGINPALQPKNCGAILREGRIWAQINYVVTNNWEIQTNDEFTYLSIDPQVGVQDEILFPAKFGVPGKMFEITPDALFVEAEHNLFRYRFTKKNWEKLPAPMDGATHLVWIKDRLYVSRNDGLITIQPDTGAVQILVSSRRQPAVGPMDSAWEPNTVIFPQADGRLGALMETGCSSYDPVTTHWETQAMAQGTNRYPYHQLVYFTSPAGAQWYFHGPYIRHYLVGFWNGNQPGESLLMEQVPFFAPVPIAEDKLNVTRWDWPKDFSLEPAAIYSEDHKLWVLCPRDVPQSFGYYIKVPARFSDERNATLFYFGPDSRQPLSVPIQFEIPGPDLNPFVPRYGENGRVMERISTQVGNQDLWGKSPAGWVFAPKFVFGHWLIPEEAIQAKLDEVRSSLPISQNTTGTKSPAP